MAKTKIKASKTLLAWSKCRISLGVKPFKKIKAGTKKKIAACVAKRIGVAGKK